MNITKQFYHIFKKIGKVSGVDYKEDLELVQYNDPKFNHFVTKQTCSLSIQLSANNSEYFTELEPFVLRDGSTWHITHLSVSLERKVITYYVDFVTEERREDLESE